MNRCNTVINPSQNNNGQTKCVSSNEYAICVNEQWSVFSCPGVCEEPGKCRTATDTENNQQAIDFNAFCNIVMGKACGAKISDADMESCVSTYTDEYDTHPNCAEKLAIYYTCVSQIQPKSCDEGNESCECIDDGVCKSESDDSIACLEENYSDITTTGCEPGDTKCDEYGNLVKCLREHWVSRESCPSGQTCNAATGSCEDNGNEQGNECPRDTLVDCTPGCTPICDNGTDYYYCNGNTRTMVHERCSSCSVDSNGYGSKSNCNQDSIPCSTNNHRKVCVGDYVYYCKDGYVYHKYCNNCSLEQNNTRYNCN